MSGLVAMADARVPGYPKVPGPLKRATTHFGTFLKLDNSARAAYLKARVENRIRTTKRMFGMHEQEEIAEISEDPIERRVLNALAEAYAHYVPTPLSVDVLFLSADTQPDWPASKFDDPLAGWGPVLRGRIIQCQTPGAHLDIFEPRCRLAGGPCAWVRVLSERTVKDVRSAASIFVAFLTLTSRSTWRLTQSRSRGEQTSDGLTMQSGSSSRACSEGPVERSGYDIEQLPHAWRPAARAVRARLDAARAPACRVVGELLGGLPAAEQRPIADVRVPVVFVDWSGRTKRSARRSAASSSSAIAGSGSTCARRH
jgi:hypothetical protein